MLRRKRVPLPIGESVSYPLRAWVEGHYACDRGMSQDANPYRSDDAMGRAWADGWLCREQMSVRRPMSELS